MSIRRIVSPVKQIFDQIYVTVQHTTLADSLDLGNSYYLGNKHNLGNRIWPSLAQHSITQVMFITQVIAITQV